MANFWKNKKVVVAGGAGFIGSHCVDALLKKQANVTILILKGTSKERIKESLKENINKIEIVDLDLLEINDLVKNTKECDILFNFAAMDGSRAFKLEHSAEIFRINSQIVLNILETSRINKIKRTMLMSSVEVLSQEEKDNGYVLSKRFSETAAKMYQDQYGMKIAVIRAGNAYGPGDYFDKEKGRVVPTFVMKGVSGQDIQILGDGNQKLTFIYVKDLVVAILNFVEKLPSTTPINIAGEHPISINKLADKIISLTGNKSKTVHIKGISKKIQNKVVDVGEAIDLINFKEETNIEEGLREVIKSYTQSLTSS